MRILLLEPFFSGSHKKWAEEFQRFSTHQIEILSLSGSHWKWRMHGGAVTLATQLNSKVDYVKPDLILATDMIDLNLFLSLTRQRTGGIPVAVYFHENQLNYPWSPTDADVKLQRDNHYAFINYTTALSADRVFFNSSYHKEAFLAELPVFLKAFPDHQNLNTIAEVAKKSVVLPLALDLRAMDKFQHATMQKPNRAVLLWNHRWEFDKNPERFFNTLFELNERGIDFKLIVLGESYGKAPHVFQIAREVLADKLLHMGFAKSQEEYVGWLRMADLLPVTSIQDFFGGSVVEAMYNNVVPFLPKRLAYPEHIPNQFHSTFFYDEADFANKLQRRIMDVKYIRVMDTKQYAVRYDWSNLIGEYDRQMSLATEIF